MTITEIKKDLFKAPEGFAFAHCISEDYAMGAGIAVMFEKLFKIRRILKPYTPEPCMICSKDGRTIFNLVTKVKYWHKPTYASLTKSIEDMKRQIVALNIKQLAIPKIGSGLDRLQWGKVKAIIENTFKDVDIEIVVYYI